MVSVHISFYDLFRWFKYLHVPLCNCVCVCVCVYIYLCKIEDKVQVAQEDKPNQRGKIDLSNRQWA